MKDFFLLLFFLKEENIFFALQKDDGQNSLGCFILLCHQAKTLHLSSSTLEKIDLFLIQIMMGG